VLETLVIVDVVCGVVRLADVTVGLIVVLVGTVEFVESWKYVDVVGGEVDETEVAGTSVKVAIVVVDVEVCDRSGTVDGSTVTTFVVVDVDVTVGGPGAVTVVISVT